MKPFSWEALKEERVYPFPEKKGLLNERDVLHALIWELKGLEGGNLSMPASLWQSILVGKTIYKYLEDICQVREKQVEFDKFTQKMARRHLVYENRVKPLREFRPPRDRKRVEAEIPLIVSKYVMDIIQYYHKELENK